MALSTNLDLLGDVADVANHEGLTLTGIQREVTIEVGGNTVRRTFNHYTGTDNGTHGVRYGTSNLFRLLYSGRLRRVAVACIQ